MTKKKSSLKHRKPMPHSRQLSRSYKIDLKRWKNLKKHVNSKMTWYKKWNECWRITIEIEPRGTKVVRALLTSFSLWVGSGGAKVSCILSHRGLQLAYSWTRPAILVAGKCRRGVFLFLLFLHFHSCSSFFPVPLFHLFYYLFGLFSPFLWETTQNDPQGLTWC